ncbi:MAG: hypothetical protein QM535_03630 [Limnohabitans sp.]|nr:hypothetical protein [Limnohabitans sp.]
MVFVFNADAFVVAFFGLLFCTPIGALYYFNVIEEDTLAILGSWILFFTSIISGKSGLRGRFFFIIPTWVVTFGLVCFTSYYAYDKLISIIKWLVIAIIFFLIVAYFLIFLSEKKRERNLNFVDIVLPEEADGNLIYWNEIKKMFYSPLFGKWSLDVCDYNIRVLEFLKANQVELKTMDIYLSDIIKVKNSINRGDYLKPDNSVHSLFMEEINQKINALK